MRLRDGIDFFQKKGEVIIQGDFNACTNVDDNTYQNQINLTN